jgi:hypothetical protein
MTLSVCDGVIFETMSVKRKKIEVGAMYVPFLLQTSCMESDRANRLFRLLCASLKCWSQKARFVEDGF